MVGWVDDSFALNLVSKKGGDDGEEPIDDVTLADNAERDRCTGESWRANYLIDISASRSMRR
jgi:hypothetical protein